MRIRDKFKRLHAELKPYPQARLLAVIKKREVVEIRELIAAGAERIAFSTVQDAALKLPELAFAGETHFIGRLQLNKVRKAVQLFDVIQSVDSVELARKVSDIAGETGALQRVLLQINVADDPHKAGFKFAEFDELASELAKIPNLSICGFMTIGKADVNEAETRATFRNLQKFFTKYRESGLFGKEFTELSMGMSGDYGLALAEGATLIRVGTALFENP